mmetsp:Transcript_79645/g.213338  ORF Transcript_79645/g.213338 Transcript_79645/m.213338 type:complete len:96 (-) Transcript_79645:65-352(-)
MSDRDVGGRFGRRKPRNRVGAKESPKQQNVGLRPMKGIMLPAPRLLDANLSPLIFGHQAILGTQLCHVRRQNNMPVFIRIIVVFLTVLNRTGHGE